MSAHGDGLVKGVLVMERLLFLDKPKREPTYPRLQARLKTRLDSFLQMATDLATNIDIGARRPVGFISGLF